MSTARFRGSFPSCTATRSPACSTTTAPRRFRPRRRRSSDRISRTTAETSIFPAPTSRAPRQSSSRSSPRRVSATRDEGRSRSTALHSPAACSPAECITSARSDRRRRRESSSMLPLPPSPARPRCRFSPPSTDCYTRSDPMMSLVIPVHNEEPVLPMLFDAIREAAPAWNEEYEVVMVDDGSSDGSYALMTAEASRDRHLRIVKLSRNFGHQAAITAGLRHSAGDAVVILDADLQDPPGEIGRFLEKWREGFHVVYGIRTQRKETLPKRAAYAIFYRA